MAAIKAGQAGLKTACVDKRGPAGGTCLNVGCIPSKSLLNNSHLYHQILHDTKKRGIDVKDVTINLEQMMKAKDDSVSGLTKGVEFLFKKNKVDYIKGTASFTNEHDLKVNLMDGGETQISGKNIIVATGSESTPFPGLPVDEERVVSSTGAIALKEVPKKLVVIGGGIIGLEMVNGTTFLHHTSMLTRDLGLSLAAIRIGSHRRRVPFPNWRSRNGRRYLKASTENLNKAGHEVQAEHQSQHRQERG